MAEKPRGPKNTQTMEAWTPDDGVAPTGGRGSEEHRGLAAFDKGAAAAPSRQSKGSSRWSGGGAPSGPPPKKIDARQAAKDDLDADLRAARLQAREPVDDDDMAPVSASLWAEQAAAAGKGKGNGGRRQQVDEVVEEEVYEEPPKKSGAWKWILGGVLLLGAGGAAAWFVAGSRKSPSDDVSDAVASDAHASHAASDAAAAHSDDESDAAVAANDDAVAADAGADEAQVAAADDAAPAAEVAPADAAVAAADTAEPAPTGPAAWAPDAIAKNPWVAIPAAPAGQRLGLRDSEGGDSLKRTGFVAAAQFNAPTAAYRLQAHEVSWGEVGLATTITELSLLERPKWLPKNANKAAALPATGVPWALARAYCRALGGDLPSEAEWEWAARGADDRLFPWGREAVDTNDAHIMASGSVPVVAVGTSKLDHTPDPTLYDLLGNAEEWTRDAWRPADPAAPADPRSATHKAVRGWPLINAGGHIPAEGTTYRSAGCADATCLATDAATLERIGFRCMMPGN
ncbi:MAG: SUMF1/EgtB/PvdO family nonheme iron enzyme [Myxococcota bacterium]